MHGLEMERFAVQLRFRKLAILTLIFPGKNVRKFIVVAQRFAFARLVLFAKMSATGFVSRQRVACLEELLQERTIRLAPARRDTLIPRTPGSPRPGPRARATGYKSRRSRAPSRRSAATRIPPAAPEYARSLPANRTRSAPFRICPRATTRARDGTNRPSASRRSRGCV